MIKANIMNKPGTNKIYQSVKKIKNRFNRKRADLNLANIISLGCPKNLVDSETIAGILTENGYTLINDYHHANIIVINTCGFLASARKEAYDIIGKVSRDKSDNQILIVCGCLPQVEGRLISRKYPKINYLLGSSDFPIINKLIHTIYNPKKYCQIDLNPRFIMADESKLFSTPKSYAYIKIADGCDNRCHYCLIPSIRGKYRSRKMEYIVQDAQNAADTGRKEIILVAQDTTLYGTDLYGRQMLPVLLTKLNRIKDLKWIRLLYTHPAHITDELIHTIAHTEKVANYIDIPLQHTADKILRSMGQT